MPKYRDYDPVVFGGDRSEYRYTLWRVWNETLPFVQFICLNPSTATDTIDDATIRRCRGFSQTWGFGAFCMTNLFAFRSTDPKKLKTTTDPIGPDNDQWLWEIASHAGQVIAAWGAHGSYLGRDRAVQDLLAQTPLWALKLTQKGIPGHPLYLPATAAPFEYTNA